MEIYYQGADITGMVQVRKCIARDTSGGRCDSLEIEFDNAAGWYNWGPEEDDQISLGDLAADELRQTLKNLDLNTLTPIEAMNLLFELQRKARA